MTWIAPPLPRYHVCSIVARVREPAGLWLQGCGGWDDQDQQVASNWWGTRDLFESDNDSQGAATQQQQAGAAVARGAAAAPASPSASPAPAPASRGDAEVIDLVGDEEEEVDANQLQDGHVQEPPPALVQHQESPEPPAAAARLRRITRKQSQPLLQPRRVPRPASQSEEAQPLSRGGAARVPEPEVESDEEADEKAWHLPGHQWVLRGDIGGPPPHRPRDLLVLSTVIPYRRQFRAVTRAYQQRMQGAGTWGCGWGCVALATER